MGNLCSGRMRQATRDEPDQVVKPTVTPGAHIHTQCHICNDSVDADRAKMYERKSSQSLKKAIKLEAQKFDYLPDVSAEIASLVMRDSPNEDEVTHPVMSDENVLLAASPHVPSAMKRLNWSIQQYSLLRTVHKGYAATVSHASCSLSGQDVAIKEYRLDSMSDLERLHLYREITLHSELCHPHIVQFYAAFKDSGHIYIVLEYVVGIPLHGLVDNGDAKLVSAQQEKRGILSERSAVRHVLADLVSTALYLHNNGIIHRDIKAENIMMQRDGKIKLVDFGLAIRISDEIANTRAGTLTYMAPEALMCKLKRSSRDFDKRFCGSNQRSSYPSKNEELFSSETTNTADDPMRSPVRTSLSMHSSVRTSLSMSYGCSVDVWAVGVLAYYLLHGKTPFEGDSPLETVENIAHHEVHFHDGLTLDAQDFILSALAWDPAERPGLAELQQHSWITKYCGGGGQYAVIV